jgi:hypothetical protein
MTVACSHRASTAVVLALLASFVGANAASGADSPQINYLYSTYNVRKPPTKDFEPLTSSTSRVEPHPRLFHVPNFSPLSDAGDPAAPAATKSSMNLPWERIRKTAPDSRWRPLAPAEGSERAPLNGVALRFWDEGATMRDYR